MRRDAQAPVFGTAGLDLCFVCVWVDGWSVDVCVIFVEREMQMLGWWWWGIGFLLYIYIRRPCEASKYSFQCLSTSIERW